MTQQRFWTKVECGEPDECWNWVGPKDAAGYGQFAPHRAHRFAYELLAGPIPAGLTLDHLCRNPSCVNPSHLEPVTNAENVRRGDAAKLTADDARAIRLSDRPHTELAIEYGVHPVTILHVRKWHTWADIEDENGLIPLPNPMQRAEMKAHCPKGHPLSGDNLYLKPGVRVARICRTCRGEYMRNWRAKKAKAALSSVPDGEGR